MAAKSSGPVDRVVMVPRKADGSPALDNYEVIGDKDFAIAAAAEQLGQNAVSTADHDQARAVAAGTAEVDPDDEARQKKHRDLMVAAAKQAASEIEAAHSGDEPAAPPLERSVPVEQAVSRTSRKSS